MTTEEIAQLLTDPARPGAPEPTLLPWLARRVAQPALPAVAKAAASVSPLAPREGGWPVIADATAPILAGRARDPAALGEMLGYLPPVAAYLNREQYGQIRWADARPDCLGYAAMAGFPVTDDLDVLVRRPLWAAALSTAALGAAATTRMPPLADLRSLASGPARDRAAETDEEAVYLLPFRFAEASEQGQALQQRQAAEAIGSAARDGRHWYAAALLARAAPYLGEAARASIQPIIAGLPAPWPDHLARLTGGRTSRWRSDEDELAASHPLTATLTEMAAAADPAELAEVCRDVTQRITDQYGLVDRWEPDDEDWEPGPEIAGSAPETVQSYRLGDRRLRLLEIAEATPARFVNVYVAEAGLDEPVHGTPLTPGRDYEVCCNIGPADDRSLLDEESAEFPEQLLPEAPLSLHAVLFVNGQATASATIELPAAGASAWVRLALPRSAAPSVIRAELTIYYDISVVAVYSLTIPVGGAADREPRAKLQFRLSRSLTDLPKLAGRGMVSIRKSCERVRVCAGRRDPTHR